MDASSTQLGAVITQDNRPIAFFSRKLSKTQKKYSVTEIEPLAIVVGDLELKYLPGGTVGSPAQPGLTWRNRWLPSPTRINLSLCNSVPL